MTISQRNKRQIQDDARAIRNMLAQGETIDSIEEKKSSLFFISENELPKHLTWHEYLQHLELIPLPKSICRLKRIHNLFVAFVYTASFLEGLVIGYLSYPYASKIIGGN